MKRLLCALALMLCLPVVAAAQIPGGRAPVVGSLVNGIVVKAAPGNLTDLSATAGAAALYLYAFNSTTVPADGAVVAGTASGNYEDCIPLAINTRVSHQYDTPLTFTVGVSLALSSTACGTLTKAATAIFVSGRAQ